MEKKILAALDGSEQAMDAIRYISRLFPPHTTRVVLFHVEIEVPESFLDLSREPRFHHMLASVQSWASQRKINVDKFMTDAERILTDSGFPPESVEIKVQTKKVGITRDILKESQKGYSLIIAGRTGLSGIKDVIMGSVATKLIGRVPEIPIAVVGGRPDSKKILIGFDGSEGAMMAVGCVGKLMGNTDCEVTLCHVIRPMGIHYGLTKIFNSGEEGKWVAENEKLIEDAFIRAENHLKNDGFASEQISKEILKRKTSRAAAIAHKAEEEGYGTVVVGRRGLTVVEEFVMGRVSTKILSMVTKATVWVV